MWVIPEQTWVNEINITKPKCKSMGIRVNAGKYRANPNQGKFWEMSRVNAKQS